MSLSWRLLCNGNQALRLIRRPDLSPVVNRNGRKNGGHTWNIHRVRTAQGKPGKPGKRDFFEKRQGRPGKLREFSNHFYNLRENSGNFLTIFTTSGKTQGISFCQISLIKQVMLSE